MTHTCLDVTTQGTRQGVVHFALPPDNADHVTICLDRQLILALRVHELCLVCDIQMHSGPAHHRWVDMPDMARMPTSELSGVTLLDSSGVCWGQETARMRSQHGQLVHSSLWPSPAVPVHSLNH